MTVISSSGTDECWSLEKLRVLAFIHVPSGVSFTEARSWLIAGGVRLPREVITAICELHIEDKILESWRVANANR